MKSLLALFLSVPVLAASAQSAAPSPAPSSPDQHAADSCPIRAEEAYLSSEAGPPSADPAKPSQSTLTLHLTLLDNDARTIRSYMVHARIATRPSGSVDNLPHWSEITRSGSGVLRAGSPRPMEWSFPAANFTTRLQSVWFDKVVFTDGSTWTKTPNDSCTFRATGHVVQTRR